MQAMKSIKGSRFTTLRNVVGTDRKSGNVKAWRPDRPVQHPDPCPES